MTEYLEDALGPSGAPRAPPRPCDGCTTYVEQMRQTIAATGAVGPEAIPPEGLERLIEVYRAFPQTG